MTQTEAPPTGEETKDMSDRQYTRFIVDTMSKGNTPVLNKTRAGRFADILKLLIEDYEPTDLDGFHHSIEALKNKHKAFKEVLEETTKAPVGILMSDVKPEKVNWLWKPRLALGKMAMVDGDPGLGKSIITIDLAARVTTGRLMPDGSSCAKGGVVLITPEDGLADTIQPRLARAGADMTKVLAIGTLSETDTNGFTYNRPFTLPGDLQVLEQAIERVGAVLVIIDPVMAILGTKDTYKDNEVRSILSPVQMLVEKAGAACILVRHLTKKVENQNALYRGGGSIAFSALARTALIVVKDPTDESRNILAHIKSNVNKLGIGLTYTVTSDEDEGDDRPYIVWGETSSISASDLLATPRKNTGGHRQDILNFLKEKAPEALTLAEINEALPDMSMDNLKRTLARMYNAKEIGKSARGAYHAL